MKGFSVKRKILIICIAAAAVLGGAFIYATTTPHYSIFLLTRAIEHRDPEAALKYLDIDSLAESAAKNLFAASKRQGKGDNHLAAAVFMNMPSIKDGLREYLTSLIRSGAILEAGQKGLPPIAGFDLHEFGALTLWRLDITTEGKDAMVRIKGKPGQSAQMKKTPEGYWKFVGVNLEEPGKD